ncbi:hypothetical protein EV182_006567 [Spiromyces aspiralis]|uniref:Uncharacterized protein n=1 Tax=Spiromyces aspiralis TaxID=68401 RepID=A0ACC1HPD9_9FUNG|nr:hypothetical protein EV182_006567 [Spiromyces aspiralis]
MSRKLTTRQQLEELLDRYDTFLFDCDGVIWLGNTLVSGAKEALELLKKRGKRLIYITNNSMVSREDYTKKFARMGLSATKDEVFSSSHATATYLAKVVNFPRDKTVYYIGGSGIKHELDEAGIQSITDEATTTVDADELKLIQPNPEVGAVVFGLDLQINYRKLARAHVYLSKIPGCLFVATNTDTTLPMDNNVLPGCGSLLASLIHSVGRQPVVIGKPNKTMMDVIEAQYHIDPKRTLMVGDRIDTDIEFGANCGIDTLLVLTGVTNEAMANDPTSTNPTYYMDSIGDFSQLTVDE